MDETIKAIEARAGQTLARLRGWSSFEQTITPVERTCVGRESPASHDGSPGPQGASTPLPVLADTQTDLDVLEVLAVGGMGRVLLARQQSLRRDVAVKTVRPDIWTAELEQALQQEGVINGSLEHPNIIPVHALGADEDGGPLLVMKRVEGVAWETLLREAAHPAWARLPVLDDDRLAAHLTVLVSVCSAVHYAHRRGVLHRDIKPSNVMLGEFGEVYLVDWGVATALDPTDPRYRKKSLGLVGTPGYLAPEMVSDDGGEIDERTDVYLLGATLHFVLSGETRHQGNNLLHVFHLAGISAPASYGPAIPEEVAAIANRACHVDPAQRFPSVAAFRQALTEFLTHRGSITLADNARERLERAQAAFRAAAPEHDGSPDRRPLRQLLMECRYGFVHALESWPGNQRAKDGLWACAELALRVELADGNLPGAEATLTDLPNPTEELAQAVAALRLEVQERHERDTRYRELERQRDWSTSAGMRVVFFVAATIVGIGFWLWANGGHVRYQGTLSRATLATHAGMTLMALGLLVAIARRRILTNQVNKRLVFAALLTVAAVFANRLANCIAVPPTAALISSELVICALAAALGGLVLAPWLWLLAPIWLAGAFLSRALPDFAGLIFVCAALLSLAVAIWRLGVGKSGSEKQAASRRA